MRRVVGGLTVVAVLVVGGCSGAPPTPSPIAESSSPTVIPTTPSATSTPSPEPWQVRSVDGADAFARHWVEVLNHASVTGDTSEFQQLSWGSCKTCSNYVTYLARIYGPGGHMETDGWRVLQLGIGAKRIPSSGRLAVALRVNEAPEKDVYVNPHRVKRYPGGLKTWIMHLSWRDGWRVSEMQPT